MSRGVEMGKVFGIGLNKTGTRSVAAAMRMLGYRTLHKGDAATSALVDQAHEEGVPLLRYIGEQFDAYFDVRSITQRYGQLNVQYPGSKFILTTREIDGWLDSREKHVRANQARAARGEYSGSWLSVDRDAWRAERVAHEAAVTACFADRPGALLVIDVVRGDGWEVLAPFLDCAIPTGEFPWENRDGAGTYRPYGASGVYRARALLSRAANVGKRLRRR